MTSATSESGSGVRQTMVQLTNLPDLTEVSHLEIDAPVLEILKKSVLFQLNSLNICISNFALDEMVNLVAVQMDGMFRNLHNLALLQRRSQVSQADLKLLFREFNLNSASLFQQLQISEHIKSKHSVEYEKLVKSSSFTAVSHMEDDEEEDINNIEEQQNEINVLLPPSNPLEKLIPSWLPNFPPDHTYKFTPEFNHPITDLKTIKREIVKESEESERALLNLNKRLFRISSASHTPSPRLPDASDASERLEIWGNTLHERKTAIITKSFNEKNIEQYAKYRIELARERVSKFEVNQLKRTKNPFLKTSESLYSFKNPHQSHKVIQRSIDLQLRKSVTLFMHNLPKVQKLKKEKIQLAKEERQKSLKRRQEELISQRKKKEQDEGHDLELLLNNEHARESTDNDTNLNALNVSTIDINANADGDEDDDMNLFGILGSSEDENELSNIQMETVAGESEPPTAPARDTINTTPVTQNTTNIDTTANLSILSTPNENAPTSPPTATATDDDINI